MFKHFVVLALGVATAMVVGKLIRKLPDPTDVEYRLLCRKADK